MTSRFELVSVALIKPHPHNVQTHSRRQIAQIADSIREFGFAAPVLIDENYVLIAGHGRLEAARALGLKKLPAVTLEGLSEAKKRALMLADNRIARSAGTDRELLSVELDALSEILTQDGLDISITGFEPAEIDALYVDFEKAHDGAADEVDQSQLNGPAVSRPGDLWLFNKHRLLCGDARRAEDLKRLLAGERASMAFLDPPYNVKIRNVVGRGARKHREFAMASGEMGRSEFADFLRQTLARAAEFSVDGAVHFVCMDWRHLGELLEAGRAAYGDMLNLIAWVKSSAGQGSFYRSQHEMIGVYRVGGAPHLNTIELGRHGRNRSNVWNYAGANSFRQGRSEDLKAHPTVKPTALIADAMKDCTRRNDVVLDTFCGSGATLLAAEKVGRRGFGVEIEPRFVDLAIRRWQATTGRDAIHAESGQTFDALGQQAREPTVTRQTNRRLREV